MKALGWILPIIAIVGVIVGYVITSGDESTELAVGDCTRNTGTDDAAKLEKLDCSDPKAEYKVLAKKDGTHATLLCQDVQGTRAAFTLDRSGDSFTLCLGENTL